MTQRIWRVLVIDDNPVMAADAMRELEDAFNDDRDYQVAVAVETSFDVGLQQVKDGKCDIAVLDVRRDKTQDVPEERDKGRRVYFEIREMRFLPIIFWTALPQEVMDQKMPPLVEVFPKEELDRVPDAIRAAISSGTAEVMADIEDRVAGVMRQHLWAELAPHWREDTVGGRVDELAHVLIARVAHSLADQALPELTTRPSHCYLYPPVSKKHRPGDLLNRYVDGNSEWWVVLTPACDLEHDGKVDFVLLGKASLLSAHPKYLAWATNRSSAKWSELKDVLEGKIARFQYLPKFREIPDLVLDLDRTLSAPIGGLQQFSRMASLVRPYCDALLTRFSHYRGRIGTPDLNTAIVKERLSAAGPTD